MVFFINDDTQDGGFSELPELLVVEKIVASARFEKDVSDFVVILQGFLDRLPGFQGRHGTDFNQHGSPRQAVCCADSSTFSGMYVAT